MRFIVLLVVLLALKSCVGIYGFQGSQIQSYTIDAGAI